MRYASRAAAFGLAAFLTGCATLVPQRVSLEERFLSPPGTVIRASREDGMRAMVHLAATQETEVCVLYLPDEEAWIPHATKRTANSCEIDFAYSDRHATTTTGKRQEFWHTHTEHGVDYRGDEQRNRFYWIVPSPNDLVQLYDRGATVPGLRGVIATKYGALTYWGDEYPVWYGPIPGFANLFTDQAAYLQSRFLGATIDDLTSRARSHRGIVWLRFETADGVEHR